MAYLIQFLCLWFEPAHVHRNVTVLILQLTNSKNTKSHMSIYFYIAAEFGSESAKAPTLYAAAP